MKRQDYEQEIIDQLIYNYQELKLPLSKVGEKYGISRAIIKRILQENNIRIRTAGETKRKYNVDVDFFSKESPEMAYILGFIAADGSIRKNGNLIKIGLSSKDKEQLSLIKRVLRLDNPIKDYTNTNNYEVSELTWSCEQHKRDLSRYGVVPAKTYAFNFPTNLSKEYWRDFIRGYFDGDGCITGRRPEWKICAYKKELLETINSYFLEEGINLVNIHKKNDQELYDIRYTAIDSLQKIYNLLYYSNDVLYMKRKKEKFDSYKMI